jgi:hypothetical protein
VGQALPPAADPDHFGIDLARPIDYRLDDGIQAGNIAAACEYANTLSSHGAPCVLFLLLRGLNPLL